MNQDEDIPLHVTRAEMEAYEAGSGLKGLGDVARRMGMIIFDEKSESVS